MNKLWSLDKAMLVETEKINSTATEKKNKLHLILDKTLTEMGFSWQEYWSGLPCPSPGNLSDPGVEPESLKSPAFSF